MFGILGEKGFVLTILVLLELQSERIRAFDASQFCNNVGFRRSAIDII